MKKIISELLKSVLISVIHIVILTSIISYFLNNSEKSREFLNFGTIHLDSSNLEEFGPYDLKFISQDNNLTIVFHNNEKNSENIITKTHIEMIIIILISMHASVYLFGFILMIIGKIVKIKEEKLFNQILIEKENVLLPSYSPLIMYKLNQNNFASIKMEELMDLMFNYMIAKGYINENEGNYILKILELDNLPKNESEFIKLFFESKNYIEKKDISRFKKRILAKDLLIVASEELIDLGFWQKARYEEELNKLNYKVKNSVFHQNILKLIKYKEGENEKYSSYIFLIVCVFLILLCFLPEEIICLITLLLIFKGFLLAFPKMTKEGKIEIIKYRVLKQNLKSQESLNKLEDVYYTLLKNMYDITNIIDNDN